MRVWIGLGGSDECFVGEEVTEVSCRVVQAGKAIAGACVLKTLRICS